MVLSVVWFVKTASWSINWLEHLRRAHPSSKAQPHQILHCPLHMSDLLIIHWEMWENVELLMSQCPPPKKDKRFPGFAPGNSPDPGQNVMDSFLEHVPSFLQVYWKSVQEFFCVILLNIKQTNEQGWKYNLRGRGNESINSFLAGKSVGEQWHETKQ